MDLYFLVFACGCLVLVTYIRGTQQTVSVNACSEGLLSPTIFELKCAGKTGVFFSSNFRDIREANACCFWRDKNVLLDTRKGQPTFSELRQHQLVNSGNNISFPGTF